MKNRVTDDSIVAGTSCSSPWPGHPVPASCAFETVHGGRNNETVEIDVNGKEEPPRRQGREGRIEPRMTRKARMKESGTRGSPTSMRPGARAGRGKGRNNETVERDENGRGEPPRRQGREGRIEPRMTRMISDPEIRGIREIRGKEAPSVSQTTPAVTALTTAMLPTLCFRAFSRLSWFPSSASERPHPDQSPAPPFTNPVPPRTSPPPNPTPHRSPRNSSARRSR